MAKLLSLLTSQVYPIKYFGIFTALGVLFAMVLSLFFLPASAVLMGVGSGGRSKTIERDSERLGRRFTRWIFGHKRHIVITTILITALSLFGMSRVWINSSFLDKFGKDSEIVATDRFVNSHFGGTTTLNIVLEAKEEGAFKNPGLLLKVEKLQGELAKDPEVGSSFALTDYLRRMNRVMHEDRPEFDTIPNKRNLIAQYLLLYEMSGDPDALPRVVNYDYNRLNLTVQLKSDNSKTMNKVIAIVETHRAEFQEAGVKVNYAGSGYKALIFTDLILEGQVTSLLLSLIIVILLLAMMFRSIKLGLIGAVPITLTALISFGVMGLMDIPLSTTTALLASITIGVGIDYAVHFIDRYRVSLHTIGDPEEAMGVTMGHAGRAIFFNAVVVVLGFLVLLMSDFPPNRALGALIALGMFVSFLGTVTVMVLMLDSKKHINRGQK